MKRRVEILDRKEIFRKFIFRIEEVHLRHERFDGTMSRDLVRLNISRGDSVAAIVHNPNDDTILLTDQFRYSTYEKTGGWIYELPAGTVEDEEDPADTMRREMQEEIGFEVDLLHHIATFYLSPGGTSERILLYYARLDSDEPSGQGGGLEHEGEDIRTQVVTVDEALNMLHAGQITDAKTLIGLQWLQINRARLGSLKNQDD
jgi:ADP-ribose pyrophosphatase